VRCHELMSICQEKDDMVSVLQTALDQNVEAATKDVNVFYSTIITLPLFEIFLKKSILLTQNLTKFYRHGHCKLSVYLKVLFENS